MVGYKTKLRPVFYILLVGAYMIREGVGFVLSFPMCTEGVVGVVAFQLGQGKDETSISLLVSIPCTVFKNSASEARKTK